MIQNFICKNKHTRRKKTEQYRRNIGERKPVQQANKMCLRSHNNVNVGLKFGNHRSVKQNLKPRKRPKYDDCSISNQIKWYSKHKSKEVKRWNMKTGTWNMKTGTTKQSPLNGFLTKTHTHTKKRQSVRKNLIRKKCYSNIKES